MRDRPRTRVYSFPRGDHTKHFIQTIHQKISIILCKAHRRLDSQRVAGETTLADQETSLLAKLEQVSRLRCRRLFRLPVAHELDPQHQAHAAHLADQGLALLELDQAIAQVFSDSQRVLLYALAFDYFQRRQSLCRRNRVAPQMC